MKKRVFMFTNGMPGDAKIAKHILVTLATFCGKDAPKHLQEASVEVSLFAGGITYSAKTFIEKTDAEG